MTCQVRRVVLRWHCLDLVDCMLGSVVKLPSVMQSLPVTWSCSGLASVCLGYLYKMVRTDVHGPFMMHPCDCAALRRFPVSQSLAAASGTPMSSGMGLCYHMQCIHVPPGAWASLLYLTCCILCGSIGHSVLVGHGYLTSCWKCSTMQTCVHSASIATVPKWQLSQCSCWKCSIKQHTAPCSCRLQHDTYCLGLQYIQCVL